MEAQPSFLTWNTRFVRDVPAEFQIDFRKFRPSEVCQGGPIHVGKYGIRPFEFAWIHAH